MADFNSMVGEVIRQSDILLMVIDARRVRDSINKSLEYTIKKLGKKLIYVINKCDMISKEEQDKISLPDSVQISARERWGTLRLLRKINSFAKGKDIVVGVVGFPNTGKSSVINALKGKHSAKTSSRSGFTRAVQKIRISDHIVLIDTPGILPYKKSRLIDNILIGAIDADKLRDPERAVLEMIKTLNGVIESFFGVEKREDAGETLEEIALKKHILKKGGKPDTTRMAIDIIRMWQNGKIK